MQGAQYLLTIILKSHPHLYFNTFLKELFFKQKCQRLEIMQRYLRSILESLSYKLISRGILWRVINIFSFRFKICSLPVSSVYLGIYILLMLTLCVWDFLLRNSFTYYQQSYITFRPFCNKFPFNVCTN